MASAFLGKYASVTAVDLIQRKKLNFRDFYESNLTEARFEIILILYRSIRIIFIFNRSVPSAINRPVLYRIGRVWSH